MGSHEHAEETYNARERWERDEKRWHHQQNSKQPQYQKNEHREDYQREDTYNSHSNSRRNTHRGKGNYEQFDDRRGDDRKSDFYSSRGNRQEKRQDNVKAGRQAAKDMETKPISDNKHKRNEDYQKEEDMYGEHDPSRHDHVHKGGLLHLPSQQEPEQKADSHQQRVTDAHGSNIARGDNGDRSSNGYHRERQHSGPSAVNVYSRDRHNSGPGRQKTLFDPNNPSKPIVIEEAVPRMEFKDTDSFSSSTMSPQYEGTPPASDVYSRGYGPFPPPPMGYGYGYGMPAIAGMMTPGPPMFYGYPRAPVPHPYMGEESYEAYQHGHYEGEGAPMMGMGPRGKSQNQMMAEHLLREAVPLDKQLSSLLARRLNGEETLNIINQLRQQIMVRCERVILLDLEMSSDQGVEQMMWKTVFHQMVELIRKQLAEDRTEETRFMLHNILDEGTTFYEGLISKLQSTCKFDLEPFLDPEQLPPENRSRNLVLALLSVQRCFICLGDIARYKEQNNDSGKINYAKARNWYLKAQQIAPKNGRPYNQLAILALYTKHKLDAVYYYMRSLASSNPFLTAREGLMTLFNEARKKAEVSEQKRYEEKKKQESLRQSRNLREHRVEIWVKNDGTSSTSQVDDSYGDDLSKLDTIQLNKRFVVSFLNVQGKLFTKIGMEMFPDICGQMLHEFRALLKAGAIGPQRLLQLMAMNMFAIDNTALKDESLESTCRSLLQQHSVQMSLDMFGILLKESATLLAAHIKSNDYPGRMYSRELEELIPGVKVWTDWMISHPDLWNPPPQVRDPSCGPKVDVWECVARLYNLLAEMNTSDIVKFYTDRRQGLLPVILSEDTMMSGFVPLLGKPTINNFVQEGVDMDMARDCLRVQQLQIFGLYLCGMEERPMLKYMDGRYYSVAPPDGYGDTDQAQTAGAALGSEGEDEDVVIEDEEEVSVEGDHDANVQELKARREELRRRVDEKNRIQENRNRVLEKNKTHSIEMEVRPIFLIPDTNCFIDHLPSLQKLIVARHYTIVIPLVVINELDGLAQGKRPVGDCSADNDDHRHKVKTRAQHTITFLEKEFETKNAHLKALTSKGTVMETIAFRSEETDSSGNNDDLILSCCTHYCKDKARDFMPKDKDTPIRLFRDVVLLTEDRNLRLKAHMHNVPVKDVPAFMKWSTAT
ncbi:telomerase-binding protein EST1A-like isoform X2 [Dreissena polymorpha]|uniref:telomerase-binding protein EST1A-like isoform X2 n=1 Tax=Dreissena polymorpha TaxID=45954 RepID=UPI0022642E40|nr:telomerase-binding protein EST1A-like isoform X2 [Dreissena polymorpha]